MKKAGFVSLLEHLIDTLGDRETRPFIPKGKGITSPGESQDARDRTF